MSYILDALKKSELQRQNKNIPSLPATQPVEHRATKKVLIYYGLAIGGLVGAGVAIGWMHPWQTDVSVAQLDSIQSTRSVDLPVANPPAQTLVSEQPISEQSKLVPEPSAVRSLEREKPFRGIEKPLVKPNVSIPSSVAGVAVSSMPQTNSITTPQPVAMSELPSHIQQEIPPMLIQLHAYSHHPENRMVSINSKMLHEGDFLSSGLKLESISAEGMVFYYKGYRFYHGIH